MTLRELTDLVDWLGIDRNQVKFYADENVKGSVAYIRFPWKESQDMLDKMLEDDIYQGIVLDGFAEVEIAN